MQLFNGTPDDIDWMHMGQDGIIKSGTYEEFDNARANHILNNRGARGIIPLKYGDDIEKAQERSIEVWKAYWTRQVDDLNEINRKNHRENLGYRVPTKILSEHAKEIGLEIWEPDYREKSSHVIDPNVVAENIALKAAIEERDKQIKERDEKFDAFEKRFNEFLESTKTKDPEPKKRGPGRPPKKKEDAS